MRKLALVVCALAACSGNQNNAQPDMAVAQQDLGMSPGSLLNVSTFAGQVSSDLTISGDGGSSMGSVRLDTLFVTFLNANGDGTSTVNINWEPCGITLPGGLQVPYAYVLEPLQVQIANGGTLNSDGVTFTSQPATLPVGYCDANPSADGLADATAPMCPAPSTSDPNPCHAATTKPCVYQTTDTKGTHKGIPIKVNGLTPDVDTIYVDVKLSYAVQGTVNSMTNEVNGATTSVSVQWNILDCTLRAGGNCQASDIAQLNAQKPQITSSAGGAFKSHVQPQYFSCPLFEADVSDSLVTFDPLDGGIPDGGVSGMSFQSVQRDLDKMGCASCHDRRHGDRQLHLIYGPRTWNEVKLNYQAILPWIGPETAHGKIGGRFANGLAPVPDSMKQRWIDWINAGAPF